VAASRLQLVNIHNNISHSFNGHFQDNPVKPVLDFIGAKDDSAGGDNWSCNKSIAPVKSSSSTNQHPAVYRLDAIPVTQPTVSGVRVKIAILATVQTR